jgi:hypothetical protein
VTLGDFMRTDEYLTDEQIFAFYDKGISWAGRLLRGFSYFVIADILISLNTYGVPNSNYLAIAIGLLGVGTTSARVAQFSIAALLVMAILPLNMIHGIHTAIN